MHAPVAQSVERNAYDIEVAVSSTARSMAFFVVLGAGVGRYADLRILIRLTNRCDRVGKHNNDSNH